MLVRWYLCGVIRAVAGRPQPDPISPSPLSQSQTLTRSVRVGMPPPVRCLLSYFSQQELDKKGGQPLRPHHPIWQRKVNRGNKEDIWSMASLDLPFISRALLVDPPTLFHGAVGHSEPQFIPNSTQCKRLNMTRHFREDSYQMLSPTFGHPVLNACPDGLGALI